MFRKILLPLLAAVLITLSVSGTALAAEGDGLDLVRARGEVIVVDPPSGMFQIEKEDGTVLTFFVNEKTAFRGLDSLDEMQVGWKAGVVAREDDEGQLWAVLVLAGDPADLLKARGKVIDVNTAAGKFTIQTPDGEELRFFVDENTRFGGQISSLEDLEVGMGAGVAYEEHSAGKFIAVGLVAGRVPELVKAHGEVTAVDAGLGKFEILTPAGERLTIFVDEHTRYQGQLSALDEMQVGWKAGVAAREGEDGKLTAVMVIAGIRPEAIRAQGLIANVDVAAGKFSLKKADGSVLTFSVNGDTSYKGQVAGLSDLEEGMRAGVGGYEDQDGLLIARVVLAGDLPDERPEIIRARGTIKTVSPGAGKFQLEKSDGSVVTVYVDGKTTYRGQVGSFSELEKGMQAGFVGYLDADGKIIARGVIAGYLRSDSARPGGERPAPDAERPLESRFPGTTS